MREQLAEELRRTVGVARFEHLAGSRTFQLLVVTDAPSQVSHESPPHLVCVPTAVGLQGWTCRHAHWSHTAAGVPILQIQGLLEEALEELLLAARDGQAVHLAFALGVSEGERREELVCPILRLLVIAHKIHELIRAVLGACGPLFGNECVRLTGRRGLEAPSPATRVAEDDGDGTKAGEEEHGLEWVGGGLREATSRLLGDRPFFLFLLFRVASWRLHLCCLALAGVLHLVRRRCPVLVLLPLLRGHFLRGHLAAGWLQQGTQVLL
mmetsp:Transcript_26341/g.76803  ORF Transcript_26341/g.76803 Transcript_26341/m.76803 type:complete len:267 (+) Transcript_26341:430-1230(+)